MPQENVEIVRRGFDAFVAGGEAGVRASFGSDVVLYPFPEWVEQSEYRGHDGLRAHVGRWTENFDDFSIEVAELRDAGDKVVVLGETGGRIKGSGVPIRQPVGIVYTGFRDGHITEGYHLPEIGFEFADGPMPGNWSGPVAMRDAWREALGAFEGLDATVEQYVPLDGERVLVFMHNRGRGKGSGFELGQLDNRGANPFHIRDGKVTKLVLYWNRERALQALGLPE